ncbi:hypothetical protein BCR37DRAFT_55633 [Protomyces lactucae-debilis]|uniref:Uncharacterized protein n=1 Tax=Protomyces lactucae-debilis TaxID=2754530 RepID=A0A1Y2FAD5_PROLT|nr:uncharacterized protein BCR37DRAFT_55633 [Protomyces lactucae-debilis]ORY80880.1 hypothetical protein BCR37DRAFT_55633 [Protomyces lactucae-debilis]
MASSQKATHQVIRQALSLYAEKHVLETDSSTPTEAQTQLDALTAQNQEKVQSLHAMNDAAEGLLGGDAKVLRAERLKIETYIASIDEVCKRVTELEALVAELDQWSQAVQAHVGKS